jgi:hypothetical protein
MAPGRASEQRLREQYSGVPVKAHRMMLMDRHGRNLVAAAREVLKEGQDERERERA